MKCIVVTNNYFPATLESHQGWYLIADSAITNTGKPFYMPEEVGSVTAASGIAVKISRLGKHVAAKFAGRYYSEWAPVVHFNLKSFGERLKSNGVPLDASMSFDRSLFVGDFRPVDTLKEFQFYKDGDLVQIFSHSAQVYPTEEIIRYVSDLNTLKIGDIIVTALGEPIIIKEGNLLEIKEGDQRLFHIKVK